MSLIAETNEPVATIKAETEKPFEPMPPAGPHARADLTNFDACPGAGALPSQSELECEADPGAG